MIWTSTLCATLLATGARAVIGNMPVKSLMEERMDDVASSMLQRRQASSINLTPSTSSMNMTQWNTETSSLCTTALQQLSVASNPSGTAVCYNIPSLDTTTGTFMADLRLFQVSTANGEFTNIPPQNIQVELQYKGASVSAVNMTTVQARDLEIRSTNPSPLQTYMFVGQIDRAQLAQPMTMGVLEALILPTVSLKAVTAGGAPVTTNVSSNEAVFVNGVFSRQVIMSDLALAQLAVNDVVAGLANGTVAFVLPGVNILIFPVGLVVTALWTVAGISVYTFGTFQRIGYREAYLQRKSSSGKNLAGRI